MPPALDGITFDFLLKESASLTDPNPCLDLGPYDFIRPSGMTQTAALAFAVHASGRVLQVRIADASIRSYLARAGFDDAIEGIARVEPPRTAREHVQAELYRGGSPMLIELTRLNGAAALGPVLDRMVWALRHRLKYPKREAYAVVTGVSEVCQNAFDHQQQTPGFVAMQVYGRPPKRWLEVAVSDAGAGIAATLRRNPKNPQPSSDSEAIRLAMGLGMSGHDDPTRGTGLFHLLRMTHDLGGKLQIRSGNAKWRYQPDRKMGWRFAVPEMPGVQVVLVLPGQFAS